MGCIFTERFICPKRTKKATFDGGLNGGGGGIRTQWILKICVKYWVSDLYEFNNNL